MQNQVSYNGEYFSTTSFAAVSPGELLRATGERVREVAMEMGQRIGINLLFMTEGWLPTGIGKHTTDLLDGFERLGVMSECTLFVREDFAPLASRRFPGAEVVALRLSPVLCALERRRVRGAGILQARSLFQRKLPPAVRESGAAVLLHPFNDKFARIVPGLPNIMVIHDLFYRHYGDSLPLFVRWITGMGHEHFAAKADRLVALSQFVRSDILSCFPNVLSDRVVVVPNAMAMPERADIRPFVPPEVRKPYILCVNALRRHKNTITLLKAFRLLSDRIPHSLVLLGSADRSGVREETEMQQYIAAEGMGERVTILESGLSDDERNGLFVGADLFVSPSLFEGFGRTPVEAAMVELPVLTTREASLPEATMGFLFSYEPSRDEHALAEAIAGILADPPSREKRRQVAGALRRQYAPERIAGLYLKLFREVTEERP